MINNAFNFHVVIPARMASSRLPNKLMMAIDNKPMIQHVYENAIQSQASEVVVATDSEEIAEHIRQIGGEVCITSSHHQSGTDRIAEAINILKWNDNLIVVNLQGDEPFLDPKDISLVAELLFHYETNMATLATPITMDNDDDNVVKVVRDKDNIALYFSRAAIPYHPENNNYLKHIGVYSYACSYLRYFSHLPLSGLERTESLEQLRALFDGAKIYVGDAQSPNILGIDTQADLTVAREFSKVRS